MYELHRMNYYVRQNQIKNLGEISCSDCKFCYAPTFTYIRKCLKCKNEDREFYKKINNDKYLAEKEAKYLNKGRKVIKTKKELEQYSTGSLISYINKCNEFRQGGYVTKVTEEYFIYLTPDFQTKYRVRFNIVKKMWIGDVYEVENDIVSFKTMLNKTNFPVKFGNIIIHYASNNSQAKRFKNTKKYEIMCNWYKIFGEI